VAKAQLKTSKYLQKQAFVGTNRTACACRTAEAVVAVVVEVALGCEVEDALEPEALELTDVLLRGELRTEEEEVEEDAGDGEGGDLRGWGCRRGAGGLWGVRPGEGGDAGFGSRSAEAASIQCRLGLRGRVEVGLKATVEGLRGGPARASHRSGAKGQVAGAGAPRGAGGVVGAVGVCGRCRARGFEEALAGAPASRVQIPL